MALTAKKVYAILKRQISDMEAKIKTPIIYRGTVATADLLPLNPDIGDMYNIESKSVYGEAGMNVAWNGVVWDTMGAPIDMSLYIKSNELADWVKQQNKPTYTAEEVGALPVDTKIPSKTSDLQNDSGFLTKIPDNYLSGTDKTLSVSGKAADAKATGDKITELSADISNKLNKNQGSENSGKIAGINESGDIVPMFPVSVDYNEETNCLEFGSDQKMELNKGINLDSTLTKTGYAADAGAVGEITNSLKEDIGNLNQKIFDEVLEHSAQLFDSNTANLHGYYNSAGTWSINADFSTQKICPIKPDTDIYTYRTFTYSSFFDIHGNWIESNINSPVDTVIHTPKNAYAMFIGTATSIINQLFVSYNQDFFIWNHDANYVASKIEGVTGYDYYDLPFIKKGRLCCNKDDDTTTAYYLGVNANTKINLIRSKFIFENYNQRSGTVAMILLGNGCNKIQNIVDLSVHCTITSTYLTVDVFGKKFGTQKYQNIISSDLKTALIMDNQTEHDAYMLVSNNTVIVNIDGIDYEGVFTPTSDISSLNDIIGNYAVLEHYCNGPRYSFNMPQFTYFQLKNNNNTVILSDTFHRQDGVPQVSPQGHLYATYSYLNNIG